MILSTSLSVPLPLQPMITIYNIRKVAVLAIGLAIFFFVVCQFSISRILKGPVKMFEIARVRDIEK